jgi:hypothetical protein
MQAFRIVLVFWSPQQRVTVAEKEAFIGLVWPRSGADAKVAGGIMHLLAGFMMTVTDELFIGQCRASSFGPRESPASRRGRPADNAGAAALFT